MNNNQIYLYQNERVDKIEALSDVCVRITIKNKTLEINKNDLRAYSQKHVFIDMDGTIADWFDPKGIVGKEVEFYDKYFLEKEPVREVIASIKNNFKNDELYILSAAPSLTARFEKMTWLDNHFPEIKKENIYFIEYLKDNKCNVLSKIMDKLSLQKENVILIDDHHDILKQCDKELQIQTYHPIHIIVMNYDK